ncbi:hypothetical protein GUJ93_ZPchr0012g22098 [Zizania palustris]|uniref:Uncharacterized protein n=1 Tax=Zizania palustris TaxID=103762 RepID=A0A8J5WV44_ZIZPA|nr:hypothetical protein GUJ93_ZPchr0012g22098 [Zizania palustris]
MAEPRDTGKVDAEGVQVVELEASEPEHLRGSRAKKPGASVPAGAEEVQVEEAGPKVAHSPLRASADSGEDFLWMFEQTNSPDQSPVVGDRVEGTSMFSLPSLKGVKPKGRTPTVVVDLFDSNDEDHSGEASEVRGPGSVDLKLI